MSLTVGNGERKRHSLASQFEGAEEKVVMTRKGQVPVFGKSKAVGREHDHLMNVNQIINSPEKAAAEEIDIDLEDPEVADAATKIQAGFRGMQARKTTKALANEKKDATGAKKPFEAKAKWEQEAASAEHIHEEHPAIVRRNSLTEMHKEIHASRANKKKASAPAPLTVGPGRRK